ncbi:thioredoxin family protein, partial [Myxococcota bacterium]|nr:thioredoxin family protein [Myxococcota bacterium]
MNFKNDLDLFNTFLGSHAIVLAYFSTPRCTLCKALRPKVEELLATEYPAAHFAYVDSTVNPLIAGQLSVFAVPTTVLFVEGRESSR